jgi:dihydrofolate reductase
MGKTIVIQFITLDGVVEDPDGSDGTSFGGWAMRHGPEAIAGDKFKLGDKMTTGVMLFGRRTWEHFGKLWGPRDNDFAKAMNAATKVVLTDKPVDLDDWSNSTAIGGGLTEWVQSTLPDHDVIVIGSGSVVAALGADGLVDEYRLLTFPTATGAGRQLFGANTRLELLGAEQVGPATLSTYTTR